MSLELRVLWGDTGRVGTHSGVYQTLNLWK